MIQVQLKLRIKPKQEVILKQWLLLLTRVWNWAIRKIELDGQDRLYYSKKKLQNLVAKTITINCPENWWQTMQSLFLAKTL